ncbi:hypothetical protein J5500_01745 [Candidatus Saccharibacteria bacterium]|nr:hypothetical protein [Candidatus Saccharibacteria bacterium]
MQDVSKLMNGPFYYSFIWLIIGLLFLAIAIGIIAVIFYITRRKEIKSLANLKPQAPKVIDIEALKAKYLAMVDEAERLFKERKTKASVAHQQLSLIVRLFYYEALGFHADILTLTDLKKSRHEHLTQVIEEYYPDEFDGLEKGSVAQSAEKARELIKEQGQK